MTTPTTILMTTATDMQSQKDFEETMHERQPDDQLEFSVIRITAEYVSKTHGDMLRITDFRVCHVGDIADQDLADWLNHKSTLSPYPAASTCRLPTEREKKLRAEPRGYVKRLLARL